MSVAMAVPLQPQAAPISTLGQLSAERPDFLDERARPRSS